MIIKIDKKTRIRVTPDCFALMCPSKRKGILVWKEISWFSSLEDCIQFISQRDISEVEGELSLEDFLVAYRGILKQVRDIHSKNIL